MSPPRAAALPIDAHLATTSQMVPRLDGGLTKAVPGAARHVRLAIGRRAATVAAWHPLRTLSLNAPSIRRQRRAAQAPASAVSRAR